MVKWHNRAIGKVCISINALEINRHPCRKIQTSLSQHVPDLINHQEVLYKNIFWGGSCHCSAVTNPTSIHGDVGLIPILAQWVKDLLALPWAVVYVTDAAQT